MQLMFAGPTEQRALLRADVRQDLARAAGVSSGGGDFYGPFWSDVKDHVAGRADLLDSTKQRVLKNSRRERLYPILAKGFLDWWNEHRRWTNEPFEIVRTPATTLKINDVLNIRLENFLAVKDSDGVVRYIYPYFYEKPVLRNEAARISLWAIKNAFKGLQYDHFRILDVPRGRIFSPDRCYLEGDEKEVLIRRHKDVRNFYIEIEEGM